MLLPYATTAAVPTAAAATAPVSAIKSKILARSTPIDSKLSLTVSNGPRSPGPCNLNS